ncbi:MAG: adenylate/guanylate cyclase domain-containing protein [Acidimicrobiia bacterium]
MDAVETQYVRSETGWIAYQVVGSGPVDVVVCRPALFSVDLMWDEPTLARFLDGLSSFSRHVWFDPRGTGASDPIDQAEGRLVESWVDDVVAVIDAVGCERVVVLGLWAPAAALFAATHPERTQALVLVNPSARLSRTDGYPEGLPDDVLDERVKNVRERFGTGWSLRRLASSLQDDVRFSRWAARAERLNSRRVDVGWRLRNVYDADVRHVLSAIRVPTLVVHRSSNEQYDTHARYVAEHIAGSKQVELPGGDGLFFAGATKPLLDAIEEFVTGRVMIRDDNRVLATVMFSDVVGSTAQLAEQGDERWRALLDRHDTVVRDEIERFRGRVIKTMGDGFVATFDGPGRALRCADAIRGALDQLGLQVRIGLHTGEIERRGADIGGIAVHIAQRIQALAEPGEVLASSTVKDLVTGSGITFTDRGSHPLKGVPDEWRLFRTDGHESR